MVTTGRFDRTMVTTGLFDRTMVTTGRFDRTMVTSSMLPTETLPTFRGVHLDFHTTPEL